MYGSAYFCACVMGGEVVGVGKRRQQQVSKGWHTHELTRRLCKQESQAPAANLRGVGKKGGGARRAGVGGADGKAGKSGGKRDRDGSPQGEGSVAIMNLVA